MYNNGNSSKNVTGASVVDGTLENADYADNGLSGDKIDGGIISNFQSTGIDDRLPTGKVLTLSTTGVDVTGSVTADGLTVDGGSGNSTVNLTPTGTYSTVLNFTNAASAFDIVSYGTGSASANNFRIRDGGVSRVNIAGAGDISFYGVTGSEKVRILSSGGITFNGDTAAANALDDYEEGTWTPTQTVVGAVGSVISANYRKIGSLVYFQFDIIAATTADTGQFQVVLPFAPVAFSTIQQFACSLAYTTSGANVAEVKGGTGVMLRTSHGGGNMTNATASGTRVIVSGSYIAA